MLQARPSHATHQEQAPLQLATPGILTVAEPPVTLWPRWLEHPEADGLVADLLANLPWEQPVLRICGRAVPAPRLTAWHGDPGCPYRYSGRLHLPAPWTPALLHLRRLLEETTGHRFNAVLANLYRDGRDCVGWHADDEPELGADPVVASLSLGAPRRFLFRSKDKSRRLEMMLEHGSLLWMPQGTQTSWEHCLPRTTRAAGVRVNLTFRRMATTATPRT